MSKSPAPPAGVPEGAPPKALPHPAIGELEPLLRVGLELGRRDQSRHTHDAGFHERPADGPQPTPVGACIVVSKGEDLITPFGYAAVACPVETGSLLADIANGQTVDASGGFSILRGIVHDNDFEARIVEGQNRL